MTPTRGVSRDAPRCTARTGATAPRSRSIRRIGGRSASRPRAPPGTVSGRSGLPAVRRNISRRSRPSSAGETKSGSCAASGRPARSRRPGDSWVQGLGDHSLLVGAESSRIESTLNETRFSFGTGLPVAFNVFGGKEITGAGYGRLRLNARNDVTVVVGARGDYWKTTPLDATLPTHTAGFFSPRASISWQAVPDVSVHASVYRAHRTPTLNEPVPRLSGGPDGHQSQPASRAGNAHGSRGGRAVQSAAHVGARDRIRQLPERLDREHHDRHQPAGTTECRSDPRGRHRARDGLQATPVRDDHGHGRLHRVTFFASRSR